MRVLVLGGYGTFGGHLIRLLSNEGRLTLICAGRALEKAQSFIEETGGDAEILPARIDRDGDLGAAFAEWKPDLIVDATGPFQVYGERPYRVVEAAIAAGINYVDLADGAEFVVGITQFDEAAQDKGVTVISGASTFPALSFAVIRDLTEDWQRVEGVEMGLSPSPKAGLGRNVIEAIMSYAGKPVPYLEDGLAKTAPGLVDSRRYAIAPPGVERLSPLRFSLIDLPDQTLMTAKFPDLQRLWPGVATRPQIFLRGLNWMARLVHWGALRSLAPLVGLSVWTMNHFAFGTHRGGMFLRVEGLNQDGEARTREWHMIAEGDDGPIIPSIAMAVMIQRQLAGDRFPAGARPATEDFSLRDYEKIFETRNIAAGTRDTPASEATLVRAGVEQRMARRPRADPRATHRHKWKNRSRRSAGGSRQQSAR